MPVRIKSVMLRLLSLVALTAIGLAAMTYAAAELTRKDMVQASIAKTQDLADAARTIMADYHARAQKGEFDEATAQKLAKDSIRAIRYSENEYFFVYDYKGVNIVHGPKPDREGKNFLGSKDSNGFAYIPVMVELAKAGGGHVFYYFPKAGSTIPERKVSSVSGFEPWQWFVGTGVYLDSVDAAAFDALKELSMAGGALVLIIGAASIFLARSISTPLRQLSVTAAAISRGDYTIAVPAADRADEIGDLSRTIAVLRDEAAAAAELRRQQESLKETAEQQRRQAMLNMADHFETKVKGVVDGMGRAVAGNDHAAHLMSDMAAAARTDAAGVASAAEQVNANIQTVAAATEELSASIHEISGQVQSSTNIAREAVDKAKGADACIQSLAEAASRIGEVVKLISAIAGQTNLLALNATIEAARAGEAGKGFAVVANEVKGLATQTAKATGEITEQIMSVQSATQQAVTSIQDIGRTIGAMSETASAIAAAVEEQSAATQEISRNVNQAATGAQGVSDYIGRLVQATDQVGESAEQVGRSSQVLNDETGRLQSEVDEFLTTVRSA